MPRLLLLMLMVICAESFCQPALPVPDHIVIAIFENHSYNQIINSPDAPYINKLANDSQSALFTQSFALAYPSQPNYIYLFSGCNQGVNDNNPPPDYPFTTANLGRQLLDAGKTYISYAEDLPYAGYDGEYHDYYVRRHNPAVYWVGNGPNQLPASVIQPFTAFPSNFNLLPAVSYVIPNNFNNMHDGPVSNGDKWIYDHLSSYIEWAKTHNSLFILTFDEDDKSMNNQITTIFCGQMVKGGRYSKRIDHVSLLRTIEDMHQLPYACDAAFAEPVTECWKDSLDHQNDYDGNDIYVLFLPYDRSINLKIKENIPLNNWRFSVENIQGVKVKEVAVQSSISTITLPALSSGIYVYKIIDDKNVLKKGKIIIKGF